MKVSINIDDAMLKEAMQLTGIKNKTELINLALKVLIEHESSQRLAALGGTEKNLISIRRRRFA